MVIVGLGNPEERFNNTKHNIGFTFIDKLLDDVNNAIVSETKDAIFYMVTINNKPTLLVKPLTWMNSSGEAIDDLSKIIPPEEFLIVYDDIYLPPGRIRIRNKGGDGGHNGVKSIIKHLHSDNFPRIKIGVGEQDDNTDLKAHVMDVFSKDDEPLVEEALSNAILASKLIINNNIETAKNKFNGKEVVQNVR